MDQNSFHLKFTTMTAWGGKCDDSLDAGVYWHDLDHKPFAQLLKWKMCEGSTVTQWFRTVTRQEEGEADHRYFNNLSATRPQAKQNNLCEGANLGLSSQCERTSFGRYTMWTKQK